MFRIGELVQGPHIMLARNVHLALNKKKLLVILYHSKTHGIDKIPQKIKITGDANYHNDFKCFCPFQLTATYLNCRGQYLEDDEQFFIFRDGAPVKPNHVKTTLRNCLTNLNLNSANYGCRSLRIGRATDLQKLGYQLQEICDAGRWKSNAVYRYLKP